MLTRILFVFLFLSAAARADFDAPIVNKCEPPAMAAKVREKTLYWRDIIMKRWCTGKRTARYALIVTCSSSADGLPHLTTYDFAGPGVIEKARVDIDPGSAEVLDRGLPHALVHAIVPSCLPSTLPLLDLPPWISEGMAQSFVPSLVADLKKLAGKTGEKFMMPTEQLLFENSWELAFYTQAGLLVRFLVEEMGGAKNFTEFVVELGFESAPPRGSLAHLGQYSRTFKKHYGLTIADLDAAFRKYVAKLLESAP